MALFHFTVDQMKRSEGQSAIASAAYRSGERLYSEYYGEYSDYTRKGGVICSDILLPSHAPPEFADRQTLWNAVEQVERGKKAQLAYSFEIALQNEFTIEENIALALTIKEEAKEKIKDTVHSLAADLAITEVLHKFPYEVSGGQRQRCACARAFVTNPSLILADEPTGALDQTSGREVLKLFRELNDMGNTIVMITHDLGVAQSAKRIVRIVDGQLQE